MTRFPGSWQKVARAKEQLADLDMETMARPNNNLYRSFTEFDSKQRQQVSTIRLANNALMRWGAITGEIVHDLHSALDQSICDLIRLTDPASDCENSAFPIYNTPLPPGHQRKELSAVKIPNVAAVIEGIQPHAAGDNDDPRDHPLALLRALSNWDKHRMIQTGHVSIAIPLTAMGEGSPKVHFAMPQSLKDETTVEQVTVSFPYDVNMKDQASLVITFKRPSPAAGRPLVSTLYRIERSVEDVLRKLDAVLADNDARP